MGEHPSLRGPVQQLPPLNRPKTGLCPPAPSPTSDGALCICLLVRHQQFQAAFKLTGTLFFLEGYARSCCTKRFWGHLCDFSGALQVLGGIAGSLRWLGGGDAAVMLHRTLLQGKGETLDDSRGDIAWRWGGIFDPAAAAHLPALVEVSWPYKACHR